VCHGVGEKTVLTDVSFILNKGDKMGLTGRNGAGKTTLLRILTGELLPDSGEVIWAGNARRGYLDQYAQVDESLTLEGYLATAYGWGFALEEKMARLYAQAAGESDARESQLLLLQAERYMARLQSGGFYQMQVDIAKTAAGLGLDAIGMQRLMSTLSGGQRAKVMLGKLLLSRCDALLLDEPTNFLDQQHVAWLTRFLREYEGSYVIISHDHVFLNAVTNCIGDLEFHALTRYSGSFDDFLRQKEANRAAYLHRYHHQQREIEKLEDYIRRNKARAATARMAHSRQRALDRMEKLEKPAENPTPHFNFASPPPGAQVLLEARALSIGYDAPLVRGIDVKLKAGQRLAVKGLNGIGKTTLVKTLLGLLPSLGGSVETQKSLRVGYYAQDHRWQDPHRTACAEIAAFDARLSAAHVRRWLSRAGLSRENMNQPLGSLSGGEQAKVKLCKLMMGQHDLLVFDEPTNHLDAAAKAALKAALNAYGGGILLVSHEPDFYLDITRDVLDVEALAGKAGD
ncbi:MAG: ABC-F family ATP-binding cassette domain-containing protein, partial [Eubacteriales bacterium]|nr:ABC-F family ATP-binding cassette domain-containing protein [Eubacteriales bacterium]